MPSKPSLSLDTFPNPSPARDYLIHMEIPEFTCLCPKTGQPDFATLILDYIPDRKCVELKSLKLYVWSYRDQGAFHEAVTNRILDDLAKATKPQPTHSPRAPARPRAPSGARAKPATAGGSARP